MKVNRILFPHSLQTLDWLEDSLIDWSSAGTVYSLSGKTRSAGKYHVGSSFDSSISSADGRYACLYQKLGTKGLLIKDGELLREINRSYYHADVYEYPAAFFDHGSRTYLAHCPEQYCRIEFEDVETGEIVTRSSNRKPADFFHSRLEMSPNGKSLLSKGWIWHPVDAIQVYGIEGCISNPKLLDLVDHRRPDVGVEINTASFLSDSEILMGSSEEEPLDEDRVGILPPESMAVWNLEENRISPPVRMKFKVGNLVSINRNLAWDTYKFPKILDIRTGEIVFKAEDIVSGTQSSSILASGETIVQSAFNRQRTRLAIKGPDGVTVLSIEE